MDIPPALLFLAGLIIALLGVGAGMLLGTLNEEGEPDPSSPDQSPPGGKKGRYTSVARLWRDKDSGALVVEVDGKSYLGPDPLSDAQREQMEKTARDLRAWLGMGLAPHIEPVAAHVVMASEPAAASPAAVNAVQARPAVSTAVPTNAAASIREEPATAAPASKSIVLQIEDILQDMLAGTPLEHQGIHLMEDPTRGVIVQVGTKRYEGIGAVTDPEISAVLQAAVKEWEQSQ